MAAVITLMVPARTTVIDIVTAIIMMTGTTGGAALGMTERSSAKTDTADKNCTTQLDQAVGAHGTTRCKMGSANRIADIEIYFTSRGRRLRQPL
jgi:hypothetical protein